MAKLWLLLHVERWNDCAFLLRPCHQTWADEMPPHCRCETARAPKMVLCDFGLEFKLPIGIFPFSVAFYFIFFSLSAPVLVPPNILTYTSLTLTLLFQSLPMLSLREIIQTMCLHVMCPELNKNHKQNNSMGKVNKINGLPAMFLRVVRTWWTTEYITFRLLGWMQREATEKNHKNPSRNM